MGIDPREHQRALQQMSAQMQQQVGQPQVVQPQPTPETWRFDVLTNGMVMITISCVTGEHVSFLDGSIAVDTIGPSIIAAGRQAKSGLIIPPSGAVDVSRNGHPPAERPPDD